jgi:hypothetical protein
MYWQSVEVALVVLDKQSHLAHRLVVTVGVMVVVVAVAVVTLLLVQPFYSQETQPTQ